MVNLEIVCAREVNIPLFCAAIRQKQLAYTHINVCVHNIIVATKPQLRIVSIR